MEQGKYKTKVIVIIDNVVQSATRVLTLEDIFKLDGGIIISKYYAPHAKKASGYVSTYKGITAIISQLDTNKQTPQVLYRNIMDQVISKWKTPAEMWDARYEILGII